MYFEFPESKVILGWSSESSIGHMGSILDQKFPSCSFKYPKKHSIEF